MRFGTPEGSGTLNDYLKETEKFFKVKLSDRLLEAELVNHGTGTPFDLVNSASISEEEKDQVRNELIYGNPQLLRQFERYRASQPVSAYNERPEMAYTIAGSFVDVGRFVTGEPECMVSFTEQRPTQFIDVVINLDTMVRDDYATMQLIQRKSVMYYSAVLSLVDSLEKYGYRVQVHGCNFTDDISDSLWARRGPSVYEVRTTLKKYSEPVNMTYLTAICLGRTKFLEHAVMKRPDIDLSQRHGCDLIGGFPAFINRQPNTIYIPSMLTEHRVEVLNKKGKPVKQWRNYYSRYDRDLSLANLLKEWGISSLF